MDSTSEFSLRREAIGVREPEIESCEDRDREGLRDRDRDGQRREARDGEREGWIMIVSSPRDDSQGRRGVTQDGSK